MRLQPFVIPDLSVILLALGLVIVPKASSTSSASVSSSSLSRSTNSSPLLTIPDDYNARITPQGPDGSATNIDFVFIVEDILNVSR